jgi:hypothetical protein
MAVVPGLLVADKASTHSKDMQTARERGLDARRHSPHFFSLGHLKAASELRTLYEQSKTAIACPSIAA